MKKVVTVLMAIIILASLSLTGCSAAPKKFKVGILAPAVTHGWVAAVAYNAEARAKELGTRSIISCTPAATPKK
jgi:ribose transport system substrate-binding protein